MEPILEPDGVDLVIFSGRWSAEVLDEVAEFFKQLDDTPLPRAISDTKSKVRSNSTEVIRPVVPGT